TLRDRERTRCSRNDRTDSEPCCRGGQSPRGTEVLNRPLLDISNRGKRRCKRLRDLVRGFYPWRLTYSSRPSGNHPCRSATRIEMLPETTPPKLFASSTYRPSASTSTQPGTPGSATLDKTKSSSSS